MRWWRAGLAVAALLVVVVAAAGASPITLVNRLDDRPPPQNREPALDLALPQDLPDVIAVPFTVFLLILAGLVLFGLVGIVLAVELPRWRRRRGTRGIEVESHDVEATPVVQRVEKALQEFTAHPHRAPRDAVIAAWLALEATEPRRPHQTPTEFTNGLGVDAGVLRNLYQRAVRARGRDARAGARGAAGAWPHHPGARVKTVPALVAGTIAGVVIWWLGAPPGWAAALAVPPTAFALLVGKLPRATDVVWSADPPPAGSISTAHASTLASRLQEAAQDPRRYQERFRARLARLGIDAAELPDPKDLAERLRRVE
ncbi:hypothetical protein [Lentzea sp. NPDC060358]|uniref:hypothetical protein n=1 Tax=Lentzea sp. NPDC060358 TaxID=3347103 RepID=UPI00365A3B85